MGSPPPSTFGVELRRLVTLAWPVVLGQLGILGMGAVDLFMVGPLGDGALAAVGLANVWSFGVSIFAVGAAHGLDPLVGQAFGAGQPRRAGLAAARGMVLLGALGVPLVVLHLLTGPVLAAFGQPTEVIPQAASYGAVLAAGVPPMLAFLVLRQLLQGGGHVREAMWVVLAGNLLNVVGNGLFVHGWLGAPAWGVPGVALSTVLVRWSMLGLLLVLGWPVVRRCWPEERVLVRARLAALAGIALPIGVQVAVEAWAFNGVSLMAGTLGTVQAAAHTAALNLSSLAFMVPLGLSAAAATRVGNLVGAGQPWQRAAVTALALGLGAMTISAAVFAAFPAALGGLYSAEPQVVALVAMVLPIAAFFQWFDGTQIVAAGILRGLGDTRVPSLLNVLGHWVIGLPVGALLGLGLGLGLRGLWMGLCAGLGAAALLLLARVISWRRREVLALEG